MFSVDILNGEIKLGWIFPGEKAHNQNLIQVFKSFPS